MSDLLSVKELISQPRSTWDDSVVLNYDERLVRRKRLHTQNGHSFMVDLAALTNLDDYWGFALEDGTTIRITPAEEPVMVIKGDLPRLAWHIGNRHTPCQVCEDSLVIRQDHVLEAMLMGLGAQVSHEARSFIPEKGAYGMGRTMGHHHGDGHAHHAHEHEHAHNHEHEHEHN